MEEYTVENWAQFEQKIIDLDRQQKERKEKTTLYVSDYLYRGQGDAEWKLETTLDRFFKHDVSMRDYYRVVCASKHKIETFTNNTWSLDTPGNYEKWLENDFDELGVGAFKAYDYFIYLRHHGFPSPLLDWSNSPYIAAFFAFNNQAENADHVSIYIFCEYSEGGKSGDGSQPFIRGLGSYVRSHKRHFLQQSKYTICTIRKDSVLFYTKHEDLVSRGTPYQDLLWKINIPVSEREIALYNLNRMNINAFSLFGTEDSLIETIKTTELVLKNKNL